MADRTTAQLQCRCGRVRGFLRKASARHVNRVVCYCDDCQRFAAYLGRVDLLNSGGGTDIIQVAAGRLKFTAGHEQIRGLRLSENGTYRWFANCCKTPVGNMVSTRLPAIGIPAAAFTAAGEDLDGRFGDPIGEMRGEYALDPTKLASKGVPLRIIARAAPKVLVWTLMGRGRPNPFASTDGLAMRYPVS